VDETHDAVARTDLANERTQLAWWRTGLTALAVAIGVGRVVPAVGTDVTRWPYSVVGAGFGIYAMLVIAYGTFRANAVRSAIAAGQGVPSQEGSLFALTAIGVILAGATTVLIVVD
jgi:putative membrane protein